MPIDTPQRIWKRFLSLGFLLLIVIGIIDQIVVNSRTKELKNQVVLDVLQGNKILSNEFHTLLHGVEDDFRFFEKKVLNVMSLGQRKLDSKNEIKSMIEFLDTHSGYFKVRLVNNQGQELLKIVLNPERTGFFKSEELYNLAGQSFYQELKKVHANEFYFSSMSPNIINGKVEVPLRPTIRVARRVLLEDGTYGILIFNIDGERVLKPFSSFIRDHKYVIERALIDGEGYYIASSPRLHDEIYTQKKKSLKISSPSAFKALMRQKMVQGSIKSQKEVIIFTQMSLPSSTEKWFLVARVPESSWKALISKERLTWLFWEALCFVLILTWIWRDEKKRHKDEVVQVLLKERGEFIQNVSHQLKTPLAIIINSLETRAPTNTDWLELKKEMNHLSTVVEDMLLLAQVDAIEDLPLKNEDIIEIVGAAVELTGAKAQAKGVIIRFNVNEALMEAHHRLELPVMGELLKSAIANVIDNAIDFCPLGKKVDVSLGLVENKIVIRISDEGPGVDEKFAPFLFQRFSRGDRSRKGSGLGLSITKKIIELHKGEIHLVKSHEGATFEIIL